jgi:hypothetical protein
MLESFAGGAIDATKKLHGGDGGDFPSLAAPLSDREWGMSVGMAAEDDLVF